VSPALLVRAAPQGLPEQPDPLAPPEQLVPPAPPASGVWLASQGPPVLQDPREQLVLPALRVK
jgi:hypothetical protein